MSVAEYPMVSVSSSNPKQSAFYQLPIEYQTGFTEYDDGGRDFTLQNGGNGIRRWVLDYAALTLAEAAILDAHAESAKLDKDGMSAYSFNFRDRDTTTLYTGVRYEKYSRPGHRNRQIQSRSVVLVKFP